MQRLIIFATIILLMAGVSYAKEFEVKDKAGGYQVEFKTDNLRVGASNVTIVVKDKSDKYVTDAKVQVKYSMPEGIELPPMHFKTEMKLDGNEYKGIIKIPMQGTWSTVVVIKRGWKTSSMQFYVQPHQE